MYLCDSVIDVLTIGESAVKCEAQDNAAMSMRGKHEMTDFFDSSTTLADKRKQNNSGAVLREIVLEKVSEVLEKSLNIFEKLLYEP